MGKFNKEPYVWEIMKMKWDDVGMMENQFDPLQDLLDNNRTSSFFFVY